MTESGGGDGDLASLPVPQSGALVETGLPFGPYQLVDPGGAAISSVTAYMRELQGRGRAESTQRSYSLALLRWFRFLWAIGVPWDQATRAEARDFMRWLQAADKPARPHWRTGAPPGEGSEPGTVNAVTGRKSPGRGFAPATALHCESVARAFYDYHLEAGTGPMVNPFPLARAGRAHAHHNPMEPFSRTRAGLYRPRQAQRIPRRIPDGLFDELFAGLGSHRDRALVAFWVSTGARAAELLGARRMDADPGSQTITVIRKGSRAMQPLPASPDAFVWLRLYQEETRGQVPAGGDDPVWWTLRRPFRPLSYHAARAMFGRANESLGANWSPHDLRHTAAYRMARDPLMPLTDVQWVLGLGGEMPRVRDPAGFAALEERAVAAGIGFFSRRRAIEQVAVILAAKGGAVADITVGDCLEFLQIRDRLAGTLDGGKGAGFYQLLHAAGIFPAGAPATLRMLDPRFQGQLPDAELIDQYAIACQPVRDLLVGYLGERRPSLDYASLKTLAFLLGKLFWKDIETHNPGISSLRLQPDTAAAWKLRLTVKAAPAGGGETVTATRMDTLSCLTAVRAFYLDIAQWALDDPARWGPWAAPCPVRREDVSTAKQDARRKSRMDQRTRERLPVLPALAAAAARNRETAAGLLAAAAAAEPGGLFTSGAVTLRRRVTKTPASRIWAEDPGTGRRRDLTLEEEAAFWAWAAIEVLRATGIRVEELTELSHHGLVQYRTPATGELVPLLHIAPSKTDVERLLVISPEVADVLAAIIGRVRDGTGAVPLVIAYDVHECEFAPPMPVLFQRRVGADSRPVSAAVIRRWINDALDGTGLTDASGQPLRFTPHDFRRIFATDAKMSRIASDATFGRTSERALPAAQRAVPERA